MMKGSGFFKQKKRNLQKTRNFSNTVRLIDDDLRSFNKDEFENNYNNIYPKELELERESADPCKASFLDLSIEKSTIGNLPLSFLIKEMSFLFISIAYPIWTAIHHRKYFILQKVLNFYVLPPGNRPE